MKAGVIRYAAEQINFVDSLARYVLAAISTEENKEKHTRMTGIVRVLRAIYNGRMQGALTPR